MSAVTRADVRQCIANGYSIEQTATRLCLTSSTVIRYAAGAPKPQHGCPCAQCDGKH